MGLLLQSRGLPFQERLSCVYADAKPLQKKLWLPSPSSSKPVSTSKFLPRVNCVLDDAVDPPVQPPQYITFDDPISGEPGPAYSTSRNNLPDRPFWSEDVPSIVRRSRAKVPQKSTSQPKGKPGSRRRWSSDTPTEPADEVSQRSVQVLDLPEEEDEDEYRDEFVSYQDANEKEPAKEELEPKDLVPLPNDKLWYNWRKIPPEKQPWHDFSRPPTDPFAVMAAAAAKRGQIKLFGDKPTVTEATLARARKYALKKERLEMEKERHQQIGSLAYYSEWVKAWTKDTSKEAVTKHFEETGEEEYVQLINMFQHQTYAEYRVMQGTDPRIERDPLTMRMTKEEKKAVHGGDPVYPTVNYYQDPNQKIDYRGQNFHEPMEDLWETLEKAGRLMTPEKLKKIHDQEASSQYAMDKDFEDAIAGAVDIGEKEEDEEKDEQEEEREGKEEKQAGGHEQEEEGFAGEEQLDQVQDVGGNEDDIDKEDEGSSTKTSEQDNEG